MENSDSFQELYSVLGFDGTSRPHTMANYPRAEGCYLFNHEHRPFLDLTSGNGRFMLGHDLPRMRKAWTAIMDGGSLASAEDHLLSAVVQHLHHFFNKMNALRLYGNEATARQCAFRAARAATKKEEIVPLRRPEDLKRIKKTKPSRTAALDLQPAGFNPDELQEVTRLCRRYREKGVLIVVDGRAAAFRLDQPLDEGDLLYLGDHLSWGLGFGALLGSREVLASLPGAAETSPPALAAALAVLTGLREQPIAEAITAAGTRLKACFLEGCRSEGLKGRLTGAPGSMTISFESQNRLSGREIFALFLEELLNVGVIGGDTLYPSPLMTAEDLNKAEKAIPGALSAVRRRMVDRNAFAAGGFVYPFASSDALIRERGIALYRYPDQAQVDLVAREGAVTIRFHAGDLGEITSAGFWVPTWLAGDFSVRIAYALPRWKPGKKPACFGLWIANASTDFTCYAQRTTDPPRVTRIGAVMGRRPVENIGPAGSDRGFLRLTRRNRRITAWHGETGGEAVQLAFIDQEDAEPMIAGAKIWAHGRSGALEAVIEQLEIKGEICAEQEPPPPYRNDPRCFADKR